MQVNDRRLGFNIQKLEMKPDDVLVVRCDGIIPTVTVGKIEAYFKSRFPDMKVMVIDKTMDLQVVSPPTNDERLKDFASLHQQAARNGLIAN